MKNNKYLEQIKNSFIIAFNNAKKTYEAEQKQKPMRTIDLNGNKTEICIN